MTEPKTPPQSDNATAKSLEQQLDEALADSFPASDPVSFVTSQTEDYWKDGQANPPDPQAGATVPKPKAP